MDNYYVELVKNWQTTELNLCINILFSSVIRPRVNLYIQTFQECHSKYDEEFASEFNQFLDRDPSVSLASSNNEDAPDDDFTNYIETQLQANRCLSPCSRLWSGDPLWINMLT